MRLKRDTSGESVATTAVAAAAPTKGSYFWPAIVGGPGLVVVLLALFWPFTVTAPEGAIDSIAILPFENRSGDPELEYVSDGIAQGVTNRLSQLSGLDKVISSSSLSRYKGQEVNAGTVAKEMDVRSVVTGRMDSLGDYIRISVELLDGENNSTLWGETYNRPRSQLYELEEYISEEIANALGIQLTGEEGERLTKRYTENSEAQEAYLKGQFEFGKSGAEAFRKAIQHFEEAIEEDPNYAPAYAAMAQTYIALGQRIRVMPLTEAMPKAEELAMKALEIDDTLSEAHAALGGVKYNYHWDWEGAEKELKLALELDPSSARANNAYGRFLGTMGRFEEGIRLVKRSQELEPLFLGRRISAAQLLRQHRRYDEAIEELKVALAVNPNFQRAHESLPFTYEMQGLYEEAIVAYQKTLSEEQVAGLADAYQTSGEEGYWRWRLDYLTEIAKQQYIPSTSFSRIYAYLGEKDRVFEQLEKAYEEHEAGLPQIRLHPAYDPIRDDPRFHDLLLRMNLEP